VLHLVTLIALGVAIVTLVPAVLVGGRANPAPAVADADG
jgi:hypothetical protein